MAQERRIKACFTGNNRYFTNSIGNEYNYTSFTGPYEYLLGALAGCYYSTLASFERKSSWREVSIAVSGYKRETAPTTLEKTTLSIEVYGAEDEAEFRALAEKAAESCSIFQTIKMVSEMVIDIAFKD